MANENNGLSILESLLAKIETDIKRARLMIQNMEWGEKITMKEVSVEDVAAQLKTHDDADVKTVEWVYDGYFMMGSDKKKYPVPMNYASKTKLIPGDVLKLRVMDDGKLIYKLIGQANRKYVKATLSKSDDNKFTAITDDGEVFFLNQAAVTYFKGKTGDEMSVIVNSDGVGNFAAIEALMSVNG